MRIGVSRFSQRMEEERGGLAVRSEDSHFRVLGKPFPQRVSHEHFLDLARCVA